MQKFRKKNNKRIADYLLNCYFKLFLTLLFLFLTGSTYSQRQTFTHYSISDGLSQFVVNCLYQDTKGYLWIGTQDGLNKFNGYIFEKFVNNPLDSNSLSNNWIHSIAEDKSGNIWIGTRGGLHKYDINTGKIIRIIKPKSTIKDAAYGIAIFNDRIFVNTPPYLNIFNPNTNSFSIFKNSISASTAVEDQQFPLVTDHNSNIWIATTTGLACFDLKSNKFSNYVNNRDNLNSISDNYITSIYEDKNKNIWVGTKNGLNRYNPVSNSFIRYNFSNGQGSNFIRAICEDKTGNLWIGTESAGLLKMKFANGKILFKDQFKTGVSIGANNLSHDIILSLLPDKSDNLWIGTLNGLDKTDLKRKKFNLYRKSDTPGSVDLLDNVIASIFKDENGIIWIGNWGKGLNLYNRKSGLVEHFSTSLTGKNKIVNDYVHVIFEDSKKNIWIGTRDGIQLFDKKMRTFVSITNFFKTNKLPEFKENRVYCMLEDHDGNIWVGTRSGLYQLNMKTFETKIYSVDGEHGRDLSDNLVYCIIEDRDKFLWIATSHGLNKFDFSTDKFTQYLNHPNSTNSLCNNFVVSLCEDFSGDIWIGTQNGLNRFDKKSSEFVYYSEKNGLPGNLIYEILEDNNKNLWFSTGRGLVLYNRKTEKFRTYSIEDGLQSLEFNLQARYKSKDGELFFGGMNGFNSFFPDSLIDNNYIPVLKFTNLEKNNNKGKETFRIENSNEIIITPDNYAFTVEFAIMEFTNPQKNQYAYKFEGKSENWIDIGNRRFLPFSNLSPGEYHLLVKGCNSDGIWNSEPARLKIIILAPWWRSKIAIICYFILLCVFIYLYIKIRERNLKTQKEILEQKIKERTAEVEKQKNEILEKNDVLFKQKEEIISQRDEIETHHNRIKSDNKKITDSIHYAMKIQQALLPSVDFIKEYFSDYFLLYWPKDIVSGDFFWAFEKSEKVYLAVVDCTGHGVPGAFMSIVGNNLLNQALIEKMLENPSEILNWMSNEIARILHRNSYGSSILDGMDLALCVFDLKNNRLEFSGVHNPLYLIRNNELTVYKADYMSLGELSNSDFISYTTQKIDIKKGDIFYLFTDGFIDQFGGINNHRFFSNHFRQSLLEIHNFPMDEQKLILTKIFKDWRGNIEQTDDVLVLGIKF